MPDGSVKLGFRAHYPQLETKLTVRGTDMDDVRAQARAGGARRCASGSATSSWPRTTRRWRASCSASSASRQGSLSIVETFTSGQIAARIAHLPGAEKVFRRGIVARDLGEVCAAVGLDGRAAGGRADARDGRGGGAGGAAPDRRHARAGGADRSRRRRRPDRVRRHDLPGHRDRAARSPRGAAASSAAASGCAWARSRWRSTACAAICRACRSSSGSTSRRSELTDRPQEQARAPAHRRRRLRRRRQLPVPRPCLHRQHDRQHGVAGPVDRAGRRRRRRARPPRARRVSAGRRRRRLDRAPRSARGGHGRAA